MASNLSPFQSYLSQKFPGNNVQISPEAFQQAANEFFGPIQGVPPGSQILSQNASEVTFIDPQGFQTTLRRSLDGRDPNAGQVQVVNTNRPTVQPGGQQQLLGGLTQGFGQLGEQQLNNALALARGETPAAFRPELAQLDPATAQALEAISQAEQARLAQIEDEQTGALLARLYGSGMQRSSIAGDNLARILQQFGLVRQQQSADAATRNLGVRQFLTQQGQANRAMSGDQTNSLLSLLSNLSGQGTQRDIASANIGLGQQELAERARQANLGFELNQQQADIALAQQNSVLDKVLKGSQIAANLAGALSGGAGAAGAIQGLGGAGGSLSNAGNFSALLQRQANLGY